MADTLPPPRDWLDGRKARLVGFVRRGVAALSTSQLAERFGVSESMVSDTLNKLGGRLVKSEHSNAPDDRGWVL